MSEEEPIFGPKVYNAINASDNSRLHHGNVYNNYHTTHYPLRQRKSDDRLRENPHATSLRLLRAASEGQTKRVQKLLADGADVDFTDSNGLTALHHAVAGGNEDTVQCLLDAGADVNAKATKHGTPMYLAVLRARHDVLSLLLKNHAALNPSPQYPHILLHIACCKDDQQMIRILVDRGLDVNGRTDLDLDWLDDVRNADISVDEDMVRRPGLLNDNDDKSDDLWQEARRFTYCSPLLIAVHFGLTRIVKLLIDLGCDVNMLSSAYCIKSEHNKNWDLDHYTSLMCAAERGHHEILTLLQEHGARTDIIAGDGRTALHYAIATGSVACVQTLATGKDALEKQDSDGCNALHLAVRHGHTHCVRVIAALCKELEVSLEHENKEGYSPLDEGARCGHVDIVNELLAAGVQVDGRHQEGMTALMCASSYGFPDCVTALLQAGADPNARDTFGRTPVMYAGLAQSIECVEVLYKHNADLDMADNNGYTPVYRTILYDLWYTQPMVQCLATLGASLEIVPAGGETILCMVARNGPNELLELLLHLGARPNGRCNGGMTPLHAAASANSVQRIEPLRRYRAEIDARDDEGMTPMHKAAASHAHDCIRMLRHFGADINAKDRGGLTPLKHAELNTDVDAVQKSATERLLKDLGAKGPWWPFW